MAAETSINGAGGSNNGSLSFAEQLQKKHSESHNPTVEEVEDEEDQLHPPPSSTAAKPAIAAESEVPQPSEKAKGKQREEVPTKSGNGSGKEAKPGILDTKSEELFPALGSGPKPRNAGAAPTTWGSKKPASVTSKVNGINGSGTGSSGPTSRASTPASGVFSPTPNSQPRIVAMPGRHRETVNFAPSELLSRDKLRKPIPDVLRDINKKSKATVEMKHVKNGAIAFEGIGPSQDVVQQALREIAKQVGAKVNFHSVRCCSNRS